MCCLDHTQVLLFPQTWETSGMDGERERRAKEKKPELDESEKGRVMQEHLSLISWKEKVSSSGKAHRTKKIITYTHILYSHRHTNRWGCFLQVPCIKTQWKTTEWACVYICVKQREGWVEDYKGSERKESAIGEWGEGRKWLIKKAERVIQKKHRHQIKFLCSGAKAHPDLRGFRQ